MATFRSSRFSFDGLEPGSYALGDLPALQADADADWLRQQQLRSGIAQPTWEEQQAFRRDMRTNLGVAGALAGVKAAAALIPTAQDVENRQQIRELKRMREAGQLGLQGKERQAAYRERLDPVAALAREQRLGQEAMTASVGGTRSAADLRRARESESRTLAGAAYAAGADVDRLHREKTQAQLAELDSRLASRSQRQAEKLRAVGAAATEIAPVAGMAMAGRVPQQIDLGALRERLGDQRAEQAWRLLNRPGLTDEQRSAMMLMLTEGGPGRFDPTGLQGRARQTWDRAQDLSVNAQLAGLINEG